MREDGDRARTASARNWRRNHGRPGPASTGYRDPGKRRQRLSRRAGRRDGEWAEGTGYRDPPTRRQRLCRRMGATLSPSTPVLGSIKTAGSLDRVASGHPVLCVVSSPCTAASLSQPSPVMDINRTAGSLCRTESGDRRPVTDQSRDGHQHDGRFCSSCRVRACTAVTMSLSTPVPDGSFGCPWQRRQLCGWPTVTASSLAGLADP